MPMRRRSPVLCLTIWCLLAAWLCFGGLELLEQVNLIPEVAAEDQDGQDLDESALCQLASGLRSEVPSLDSAGGTPLGKEGAEPAVWLSLHTVHQLGRLMVHWSPSLRLHQQLSVYRI
ncbi:MAG: hypothetical protein L0Z46_11535 [Nitrospiraceae bacterium]|nr:hypothetical protein [Nitrospiraceae bacterium]